MVEYLKTDKSDFNSYFKGLPKGKLMLIKGDISNMILKWSESLAVDDTTIYSSYRNKSYMNELFDDVLTVKDDLLDNDNISDKQLIIIEDNELFDNDSDMNEFINIIKNNNIPVLIVSDEPSLKIKGNSFVVIEEITEVRELTDVDSKIVINKHFDMSFEDDKKRILDLYYKPEPIVDDNLQY